MFNELALQIRNRVLRGLRPLSNCVGNRHQQLQLLEIEELFWAFVVEARLEIWEVFRRNYEYDPQLHVLKLFNNSFCHTAHLQQWFKTNIEYLKNECIYSRQIGVPLK